MPIKTLINTAALEAVSLFASKDSDRFELFFVFCDVLPDETRLVSSNGEAMSVYRLPQKNKKTGQFLIPVDLVKMLKVQKLASCDLSIEGNILQVFRSYSNDGDHPVCSLSSEGNFGVFPKYLKLFPQEISWEQAEYNPEMMLKFAKAAKIMTPKKFRGSEEEFHSLCELCQNGEKPALVRAVHDANFTGVIMPYKNTIYDQRSEVKIDYWWREQSGETTKEAKGKI